MSSIQMVDLKSQYQRIRSEVHQAIDSVLDTSSYINGPAVKEFSSDLAAYLSAKHVIPCGNGTDALQIACMALGLQPGDEVITVPFTFVATAEIIALLGLKPVFVDIDPDTFNIDVNQIEDAITPKTKAILPVHLYGQSADMEPILKIAEKYDLKVIEDNAQSIGAEYQFSDGTRRKTGTMGDVGCLSFYPSKNLGAYGDGGAIITNDDKLYDELMKIVNHGFSKKYYTDLVGVNSRLDSIQAAVLGVKLKYLDEFTAARREAAALYDELLSGQDNVKVPFRAPFSTHVFHQYTLTLRAQRDELKDHLTSKGIPSMIYYPVPLHLQRPYQVFGYHEGDFPITEKLTNSVISLPMHSELSKEDVEQVTGQILEFYNH